MSTPFRPDRSPVEKPAPGSRTCRAVTPGKRQTGWPLFGLLFSGHQRKVTRAPQAIESFFPSPDINAEASRASALLQVDEREKVTRASQALESFFQFPMHQCKSIARERAPTGGEAREKLGRRRRSKALVVPHALVQEHRARARSYRWAGGRR